jgi:hypothetical protein
MKIFSPCSLDWWLLGYASLGPLNCFRLFPSRRVTGSSAFFLAALLLGTSRYAFLLSSPARIWRLTAIEEKKSFQPTPSK